MINRWDFQSCCCIFHYFQLIVFQIFAKNSIEFLLPPELAKSVNNVLKVGFLSNNCTNIFLISFALACIQNKYLITLLFLKTFVFSIKIHTIKKSFLGLHPNLRSHLIFNMTSACLRGLKLYLKITSQVKNPYLQLWVF